MTLARRSHHDGFPLPALRGGLTQIHEVPGGAQQPVHGVAEQKHVQLALLFAVCGLRVGLAAQPDMCSSLRQTDSFVKRCFQPETSCLLVAHTDTHTPHAHTHAHNTHATYTHTHTHTRTHTTLVKPLSDSAGGCFLLALWLCFIVRTICLVAGG